jgi:hypothetical protein
VGRNEFCYQETFRVADKDTLQNTPRYPDKLERLLKSKRRQKEEEAMYFEDTERLVTEIEMLKVVLYLVCRKDRQDRLLERRERKEEENKRAKRYS